MRLVLNGILYEAENKLSIKFNEFRLIIDGVVVSKVGYVIEPSDKWFNESYLTLNSLETFRKYRQHGYAELLLNEVFKYAKNILKLNIISLIVYKSNIKALNLYKKLGFEVYITYEDSYCLIKKLS